ncbi:MAG: phosphatase PAP2 family protein [Eubacterium sp.]|nr:phosphatase PAP2 family protein [Eubacterium sp.]
MENSNLIQESQNDHRNTYAIRLILGAASLCVFFLIHYLITAEITLDFDLSAGEAVRALRTPVLNAILIPITHMANWRTLVGIGVILLIIDVVKWHKPDYPLAVLACLLTLLIYKILKVVVQRPRPDEIFWLVTESGFSFPSGHSLNGMFCYGMMIYLLWRNCEDKTLRNIVTAALCVLIPLIAFSRVYCGVHHPTDVIAGLAAGFALLMVNTVLLDEILLEMSKNKKHA